MKRFMIAVLFVGIFTFLPGQAFADWQTDFKTLADAGDVQGAISGAMASGAAPCDILKMGMTLDVNPYTLMNMIFTQNSQAAKEVAVCAEGFDILPELVARALFDAGGDPADIGLAYTPVAGQRANLGVAPGQQQRYRHEGAAASPTQ